MPTYDYVCEACGHALEIFQSISEAPKKKCPACGRSKLARRIGAGAGFLFKGAGFYKTDYRSESYKAGEKAASGAETPPPAQNEASPSASGEAQAKPKDTAKPARAAQEPKRKRGKSGD